MLGLRGMMMPGNPLVANCHDPMYDPLWAAVDLALRLSFPILTNQQDTFKVRGPKINGFVSTIRDCLGIIGTFFFGGNFECHPKLKLACAAADVGSVPHFMYRMDHAWERHRCYAAGRLGSLQEERALQRPSADVGERLPSHSTWPKAPVVLGKANRVHDQGRARPRAPRQRGRARWPRATVGDRHLYPANFEEDWPCMSW